MSPEVGECGPVWELCPLDGVQSSLGEGAGVAMPKGGLRTTSPTQPQPFSSLCLVHSPARCPGWPSGPSHWDPPGWEAVQATIHSALPVRTRLPDLAQESVSVMENGGVRMVAEQHSLEPGMYWGVGGTESAGCRSQAQGKADGEASVRACACVCVRARGGVAQ